MAERNLVPQKHATIHQLSVTMFAPDGATAIGVGEGFTWNQQHGKVDAVGWNSDIVEAQIPTVGRTTGTIQCYTVLDQKYYEGLPSVDRGWSLKMAGDDSFSGYSMIVEGGDNSPYPGEVFYAFYEVFITGVSGNLNPESKGTFQVSWSARLAYNPYDYAKNFS